MPLEEKDANTFTEEELAAIFNESNQETSPEGEQTNPQNEDTDTNGESESGNTNPDDDVTKTKAFAHRLKESTDKARLEEREKIAKELGYESYDAMQKSKEDKLLADKGIDPEIASEVIKKLVDERINNDPRMLELEELKNEKLKAFAEKELKELSELTGENYTDIRQLPKDVLDSWKQKGSLKKAYLDLHAEEIIMKARNEQSKGTTNHLKTVDGTPPPDSNKRSLNTEEKSMWKFFNPKMTDDELNKIRVNKS